MATKLLQGESLVQPPVRQHWIVFVRDMRWPTILLLMGLFVVDFLFAGTLSGDSRALATLICLAIYVLLGLGAREAWRASSLMITDQRVIVERGILRRNIQVIPLDRVQDLSSTKSLMGQWLNYGSIEIDTAGAVPNRQFEYAADPDTLREQMFMLSEAIRRGL